MNTLTRDILKVKKNICISDLFIQQNRLIRKLFDNISIGLNMRFFISLIMLAMFGLSCGDKKFSDMKPVELKCEYRENPLGVQKNNPKLSWILHSDKRGQKQTAYQILVSSSLEKLNINIGDLWNSNRVTSDQSVHLTYQGKVLESRARYYWKVRVWDKDKMKSDWSEPAFWEMGLLHAEDWKASWIGFESGDAAPLLRKEFEVTKKIQEARVYLCGLGYYELSINGSKISDHVLDPGQTDYEQRVFYVTYDVTSNLKHGANAIGVMLGNGWYNQTVVNHGRYGWKNVIYGQPRLILQLHIMYSDGTENLVTSDNLWKGLPGPVISNNIYAGEQYDARLEQDGWDTPGFNDKSWHQVKAMESPGGRLVSQDIPPIKRMLTIKPVSISEPKPGVYVFNMGQNFAGWAKISLRAEKGTVIKLRFAEWLGKDGMIDPGSTGVYATDVVQTDQYICKGNGLEEWEPRFSYHGFQYVEVTGFPGTPSLDFLEGIVVHTSLPVAGEFWCSDSMINKLHQTALWTEVSNMHSIPTDCPHRERCGWLGDAFLTSDMTMFNFDAPLFWSKFIQDIETSRRGDVPTNIAPGRRSGGKDPDWGAAFIQLTWNMYLYYGDSSIINEHYEGMSYFMDYLQKIAKDFIIYRGIGSLFSPGRLRPFETPKEFTTTVLFYYCADAMSKMAKITGKEAETIKYDSIAIQIKSSFNNKFFDQITKSYGGQEKNTLALAFSLAPVNEESAVAENLYKYIVEKNNGHVSTGVFGSRYIYETMGKYGYGNTVIEMLNSKSFPSYGFLFSRGATTFWENWGEINFEDFNQPGDERSKSHPFQGGFDAWFYNGIAGINPDWENPGFKHIILKPQIISNLDSAEANYNSIHGWIKSKWHNGTNDFRWSVSIPANTSATLYIPAKSKEAITGSNFQVSDLDGVKFLGKENGYIIFEIESGEYVFLVNKKI